MIKEEKDLLFRPLRSNYWYPFGMGIDPYGNPMPQAYTYPFISFNSIKIYCVTDKDGQKFIRWEYI